MAKLKQIFDSLSYYQGWYGVCPEFEQNVCEDLMLIEGTFPSLTKKYPEIHKIEQISGNAESTFGYSGTIADGPALAFQQVIKLKCGNAYRIVLKKGTSEIDIPEFSFANTETEDVYRLTNSCTNPTPTPSPLACCKDRISTRPNLESVNNLTCKGNVEGELCWEEMEGIQMPKSYLCSFEDENFSESGLKITITSNITNSRFRFKKDNGNCYEVALFHENNEGINVFQLIT